MPFLSHFEFRDGEQPIEQAETYSHVLACRERRGVEVCSACVAFDSCDLIKRHLRNLAGYSDSEDGGDAGR